MFCDLLLGAAPGYHRVLTDILTWVPPWVTLVFLMVDLLCGFSPNCCVPMGALLCFEVDLLPVLNLCCTNIFLGLLCLGSCSPVIGFLELVDHAV